MTTAGAAIGRFLLVGLVSLPGAGAAAAQDFDQTSCDEFLRPLRQVGGRAVGPASCMMQETDATLGGRTFRRLDIGLDGTVEGVVTRTGALKGVLTNAPDLVLPQTAEPGSPLPATAAYQRRRGASMTVFYPLDAAGWNRKLWVTAHGEGRSLANGGLKSWEEHLDRRDPLHDLDAYDRLVLSKGYALAKTRRTSAAAPGEVVATLEDGSTLDVALTDAARYLSDFTRLAAQAIESRLGSRPARTYFYGHSAGASLGRAINYTPGLNDEGGRPLYDGFLLDSAAGGAWLPLTVTAGARLAPQIDLVHQLYATPWRVGSEAVSLSPLVNARANASALAAAGLAGSARTYEVRGATHDVSRSKNEAHAGAGLDLAPLMDRLIDHLDAWADRGIAPPPDRADASRVSKDPAIALPDAACPLGVFHPAPHSSSPGSAFAAFGADDELEPLDARDVFVDMNRNGIRDRRETLAQAWQRLGLLQPGEAFTRDRYVGCVERAARALEDAGFISGASARAYVERAKKPQAP